MLINIQKGQKWPNHFISGKQFQKGQTATLMFIGQKFVLA